MKKFILTLLFSFLLLGVFIPTATAHELFIEVKEDYNSDEIQVDVLWGHLRDFLDNANHENYELFVRYPSGEVEQLPLESIGVQARAYLTPVEEGEYIFWAERKPSLYSPSEDVTILSKQMAKNVYQVGTGSQPDSEPIHMLLEVIPTNGLTTFSTGTFSGTVLYEGAASPTTLISAYGPNGEILETETNEDGTFELPFDSVGDWLVKANVQTDEEGQLDGEDYQQISRTSTLIINTTTDEEVSEAITPKADTSSETTTTTETSTSILTFIIGFLLGASVIFLAARKKR
ncbi:DUF4198 domain-containing protein [Bacillus sp. FJAT-45350]|uniref:DUF4198 domain-containing protein n=1 Tax=Bacillus sp. FJAT-45350 TaxID=2011014 RepID=UPI000BB98117|nr:DUF4198 domain-containing protein [Bacillus sp. FJAT-45350]